MPVAAADSLIDIVNLTLPDLPGALEGFRIAQLTDLHISRERGRYRTLLRTLESLEADIVLLTGDYMNNKGDEPAAHRVMQAVCHHLHPRLGVFGVYGNHDTHALRQRFNDLPVRWMSNERLTLPGLPIDLLAFDYDKHKRPDALMVLDRRVTGAKSSPPEGTRDRRPAANASEKERHLTLLLCHYPTMLPTASDMGIDIMFSGHTHGGQWRLPRKLAFYTASDLPGHLCAGVIRHHDTLAVVSRGIGETFVPIRILCPPHLPVYTLHRGELPGKWTEHFENVHPW